MTRLPQSGHADMHRDRMMVVVFVDKSCLVILATCRLFSTVMCLLVNRVLCSVHHYLELLSEEYCFDCS